MDPRQWQRVKDVFGMALDQPPALRGAWLDATCAGDDTLRDEVASLLAATDEDGPEPVLDIDAAALVGALGVHAAPSAVGRLFGNYRIVSEIGRGGMGTVFLAERADGAFEHRVALKLIRQSLFDADLERRVRRERQILASLNHPNIARLLDGGVTPHGEPFLVMEYVDGQPLPVYADRAGLDVPARLRLFCDVCAAVAYAHRQLVVHRDLKPPNILVTADGQPKLLDFGLAKIVDTSRERLGEGDAETTPGAAELTMTGMRAFTPAYASPEQVRGGPIATATDVYSLGVVLYELLTGTRPLALDSGNIEDAARTLDEVMPPPPSDAVRRSARTAPAARHSPAPLLEGDIDTIVMMALRKEPERRYSSVEAFADDVRRHLAGRPIAARPQTIRYRASRFVRRNRVAVAAAILVALALVSGAGIAMWQARVARAERDRATRRFDDVRALSHSLLFEIGPLVERLHGATEAREVMLARALEHLDRLALEAGGDPLLQAEIAAGYEKMGDLQGNPSNPNLVEIGKAIASYEKARAIRTALLAATPGDVGLRRGLAENARILGNIRAQANDYEGAGRDLETALREYDALAGSAAGDVSLTLALAQVQHDLGRNLSTSSRYAGAFPYFRRAIALAAPLRADRDRALDVARVLGDSHAQLGLALAWEDQLPEAEREMAAAAAIYEPLVAAHPDDLPLRSGLWSTYWLTSSVYEDADDETSLAFAARALDVIRPVAERDPANMRAQQQLARSYSRLGQAAVNLHRPVDAVGHLEAARRILRGITDTESRNGRLRGELALANMRLAEALAAQDVREAALARAGDAVDMYAQLVIEFPQDRRTSRNLSLAHQLRGDLHARAAAAATGAARDRERAATKGAYLDALRILESLRDRRLLAGADVKLLEDVRAAAARFE